MILLRTLLAALFLLAPAAANAAQQCGRFVFDEVQDDDEIMRRVTPALARLFGDRERTNFLGSAAVIDASRGLLVTAAHAVKGHDSVAVDFPARQEEDTYPAAPVGALYLDTLDVAVLKLTVPLPRGVTALELNFWDLSPEATHHYFGFRSDLASASPGSAKLSALGDHCRFQLREFTRGGDSGSAVVDPSVQLAGVVFKSDEVATQGRFVATTCFLEKLLVTMPSLAGEEADVVALAQPTLREILAEAPGPARLLLLPSASGDPISNVDLAILIEAIVSAPKKFCALEPYMECPITHAAADRLGVDQGGEQVWLAKRALKDACADAAQAEPAAAPVPQAGATPTDAAQKEAAQAEPWWKNLVTIQSASQAEAFEYLVGPKVLWPAAGVPTEKALDKYELAEFLREQAERQKSYGDGGRYQAFLTSSLDAYTTYLDANVEFGRYLAAATSPDGPQPSVAVASVSNYLSAMENASVAVDEIVASAGDAADPEMKGAHPVGAFLATMARTFPQTAEQPSGGTGETMMSWRSDSSALVAALRERLVPSGANPFLQNFVAERLAVVPPDDPTAPAWDAERAVQHFNPDSEFYRDLLMGRGT